MNRKKITNIVLVVIILALLGLSGYFYYQLKNIKINPQTIAKEEVDSLVSKVSRLYLLPIGEDPTIATVSDPDALKNQSFFSSSEKGDKVLIYTKAGKAILYRPSIDKIIETAPVNNKLDSNVQVSKDIQDAIAPITTTSRSTTKTPVKK